MFTGEYRHSVDDKGRIAVPAQFRPQLEGGAFVSRWIDACLAIFPEGRVGGASPPRSAALAIADAAARTFSGSSSPAPSRSSSTARAGS